MPAQKSTLLFQLPSASLKLPLMLATLAPALRPSLTSPAAVCGRASATTTAPIRRMIKDLFIGDSFLRKRDGARIARGGRGLLKPLWRYRPTCARKPGGRA